MISVIWKERYLEDSGAWGPSGTAAGRGTLPGAVRASVPSGSGTSAFLGLLLVAVLSVVDCVVALKN